jgi:PAS domain-containing protein
MTTSAPSRSLKWSIILNYAIAVVSAATSVVVAFAVYPLWGADLAPLLFLFVILFVAVAAGPGPAALAFVLTFLSLQYLLLSPGYPFALSSGEILRIGLFIVASVLAVVLSAARKRTSASLQLLRNNQQMTIGELQEQNDRLRVESAENSEAATRARGAEQEIRLIVDTVPALIARYRADGFMDFRNKNWREFTGLSQDNLEGRRWGSALHPDEEEMVERAWREHIATGEPFEFEQRLRKADGE